MRFPFPQSPSAIAFSAFAANLASYFLLLPLREEAAILIGTDKLATLFACSLICTIITAPLASAYISRQKRGVGIQNLLIILAGVLIGFHILLSFQARSGSAHNAPMSGAARHEGSDGGIVRSLIFAAFYIWINLQNLVSTSALWVLCADAFSPEAGVKSFGQLSAGATLGQLVGSIASMVGVQIHGWLSKSEVQNQPGTPCWLLLVSAGLLILTSQLCGALADVTSAQQSLIKVTPWDTRSDPTCLLNTSKAHQISNAINKNVAYMDNSTALNTSSPGAPSGHGCMRQLGSLMDGFHLILKSSYLMILCFFMFLTYMTSAILYFERAVIVSTALRASSVRATYFAAVNSFTALVIFILQLFATGHIMQRLGVHASLCLGPVLSVGGMLMIAMWPNMTAVASVELVRKVVQYSLSRPTRETLFTVIPRNEKYKAKLVLDSIVQRLGDSAAAAIFQVIGVRHLQGPVALGLCGALISVAWLLAASKLGRMHHRLLEHRQDEEIKDNV